MKYSDSLLKQRSQSWRRLAQKNEVPPWTPLASGVLLAALLVFAAFRLGNPASVDTGSVAAVSVPVDVESARPSNPTDTTALPTETTTPTETSLPTGEATPTTEVVEGFTELFSASGRNVQVDNAAIAVAEGFLAVSLPEATPDLAQTTITEFEELYVQFDLGYTIDGRFGSAVISVEKIAGSWRLA